MSTFSAAASTATSLISRNGVTTTFSRKSVSTYDPVTQAESSSTTTFSMPAVGLPPGKSAEFRIGSLQNRNILELHLAPALGQTPAPGDQVSWAGVNWTVIWVSALDPAADGSPYALAYVER
jgi:hypothetical protein